MIAEADPQGQPSIVNVTCSGSNGPSKKARAMGVAALRVLDAKAADLAGAACTVWMRLAAEAKARSRWTELASQ